MSIRSVARYGVVAVVAAMLAGCSSAGTPGFAPSVHPDRSKSWMLPMAKSAAALLYLSDQNDDVVHVYDYSTGEQVGKLTGMDAPYGQCVDAKGDVYIANFDAENVVEYARGGTQPINTYNTGGFAIGCSVDQHNDLAVANFFRPAGSGNVCVWNGGKGSSTCYTETSDCYYMFPPGFDNAGNLIVEGKAGESYAVCALPSGASDMIKLSYDKTIGFAGSVMWDGKYVTLVDQPANGKGNTDLERVTLSGSTLTYVSRTVLSSDCGNGADVVQPFIVGKKNTPVNAKQGSVVVGASPSCDGSGVSLWHYARGGDPYKNLDLGIEPLGQAVSFAK